MEVVHGMDAYGLGYGWDLFSYDYVLPLPCLSWIVKFSSWPTGSRCLISEDDGNTSFEVYSSLRDFYFWLSAWACQRMLFVDDRSGLNNALPYSVVPTPAARRPSEILWRSLKPAIIGPSSPHVCIYYKVVSFLLNEIFDFDNRLGLKTIRDQARTRLVLLTPIAWPLKGR